MSKKTKTSSVRSVKLGAARAKTVTAQAAPAPAASRKIRKCRAADVGHRSCNCGAPHCGANIHDPYANK